eukprot:1822450-Karenia_brevis.AAC.1
MKQLSKSGRCQLTLVQVPHTMLLVANVYCWTNGHISEHAAARSDDLISAILDEFQAQPQMPQLIV